MKSSLVVQSIESLLYTCSDFALIKITAVGISVLQLQDGSTSWGGMTFLICHNLPLK